MDIIKKYDPQETEIDQLTAILGAYNEQHFELLEQKELAFFLKDGDKTVGGISGRLFGNWLDIKFLAVAPELRKQQYGSQLLQQIETEAKQEGCKYALLYTFGFQAKGFYLKHGYQEVYTRDQFPLTGTEHFLVKTL